MLQLFSLPATLRRGGAPPCGAACLSTRPRGFALLITIVLVAFLVLILVGLATFTRVETQVASNAANLAKARQNALFALNISIGELQENLGPDRRTSAPAETVLPNPSQPILNQPHWVGAWHGDGGLRNWLVSGNENNPVPATNVDPAATGFQFLPSSLLSLADGSPVSGTTVATTNVALTDRSGSRQRAMLLVGPGTVGARPTNFVAAPMRDISSDQVPGMAAGSPAVGRYAWWVGDEGVKANLTAGRRPAAAADGLSRVWANAGAAAGNGISVAAARKADPLDAAEKPSGWTRWTPKWIESLSPQILQLNQMPMAAQATEVEPDDAKKAVEQMAESIEVDFHRITTASSTVLSDSLLGGLKRDLSLAFEIEDSQFENSEFSRDLTDTTADFPFLATSGANKRFYTMNAAGRNVPMRVGGSTYTRRVAEPAKPLFSQILAGSYAATGGNDTLTFRGPSAQLLRDHYRLYREVADRDGSAAVAARPPQPNKTTSNVASASPSSFGPTGSYAGATSGLALVSDRSNRSLENGADLSPEVLRRTYLYAVEASGGSLRLIIYPILVLHNPYNTRLEMKGFVWVDGRYDQSRYDDQLLLNSFKGAVVSAAPGLAGSLHSGTGGYGYNDTTFRIIDLLKPHLDKTNPPGTFRDGPPYPAGTYTYPKSFASVASLDGRNGTAPTGNVVFQPGEVKIFTLAASTAQSYDGTPFYLNEGFRDITSAGIFINLYNAAPGPVKDPIIPDNYIEGTPIAAPPPGGRITAKLEIATDPRDQPKTGYPSMEFPTINYGLLTSYLLRDTDSTIFTNVTSYYTGGKLFNKEIYEEFDLTRQYQLHFDDHFGGDFGSSGVIAAEAINSERQFIGLTEFYMRAAAPGTGATEIVGQNNTRARSVMGKAGFGQGPNGTRAPAHFGATVTRVLSSVDFATYFAAEPGTGRSYWGDKLDASGQTHVPLYDVPTAPLASLGALQHANMVPNHNAPSYAFGNSRATPLLPLTMDWAMRTAATAPYKVLRIDKNALFERTGPSDDATAARSWWIFDYSYVLNRGLWDSFYFSTLAPIHPFSASPIATGVSATTTLTQRLATLPQDWSTTLGNPRLRFILPRGLTLADYTTKTNLALYSTTQTTTPVLRPHQSIMTFLLQNGALNINSPYPEAWISILAAAREAAVAVRAKSGALTPPSPRSNSTPFPGGFVANGSEGGGWEGGFRELTDTQIRELAVALAEQVRLRSQARGRPFASLGDFINRELVDSSVISPSLGAFNRGHAGALQTALDLVNVNSDVDSRPGVDTAKPAGDAGNVFIPFGNEAYYAAKGRVNRGSGIDLSQADLLTSIGPHLAARSDTFKIRTYGETVNPVTQQVEGRAWLEAVVQRMPTFVDPTNAPELPPGDNQVNWSQTNRDFGRRFQVVSFRWLGLDDI